MTIVIRLTSHVHHMGNMVDMIIGPICPKSVQMCVIKVMTHSFVVTPYFLKFEKHLTEKKGNDMSKRVSKWCKDDVEANLFYLDLCDQFSSVHLVRSPFFELHGLYVWECSNPLTKSIQ